MHSPSSTRLRLKTLASSLIYVLVILIFLRSYYPPFSPRSGTSVLHAINEDTAPIPNRAHFVYILSDPDFDFEFEFSQFLSIYAAWHYWRPDTLYLHTNADETSISRARSGAAGKWARLILDMPNLVIIPVSAPTHTGNGLEVALLEQRSDFVRVQAVHDLGGVYIDWDVHALRDLRPLRESGFAAVGGRQLGGKLNSGSFLSRAGGQMIRLWRDGMHLAYDSGWTTPSNDVMTFVGEHLAGVPREMLILEREAFAPFGWGVQDNDILFAPHDDGVAGHVSLADGDTLPSYEQDEEKALLAKLEEQGSVSRRDKTPNWVRDWSCTYLLHAFRPERWGAVVEGYEHITPRYVLERRSNFARAVYPVAKEMYDQGLIRIDDSHLGT